MGGSPAIMHVDNLKKLAPLWFDLSVQLKADRAADAAFGWVLEMWGYSIACARMGVKHYVWQQLQIEPSAAWHQVVAPGRVALVWLPKWRPSARHSAPKWRHSTPKWRHSTPKWSRPPLHEVTEENAFIYHYTFGVEYTKEGVPVVGGVGEWSLDKRHYFGAAPPNKCARIA
eukprot:6597712-Prymnesium_polylepis.1